MVLKIIVQNEKSIRLFFNTISMKIVSNAITQNSKNYSVHPPGFVLPGISNYKNGYSVKQILYQFMK